MAKRDVKIEQPGAPPEAPDPSEDQTRTAALEQQVEATKALIGGADALDWSHLNNPATILSKINHNPDAALPLPEEIDWSKQTENRVLTRHGWLLRP